MKHYGGKKRSGGKKKGGGLSAGGGNAALQGKFNSKMCDGALYPAGDDVAGHQPGGSAHGSFKSKVPVN